MLGQLFVVLRAGVQRYLCGSNCIPMLQRTELKDVAEWTSVACSWELQCVRVGRLDYQRKNNFGFVKREGSRRGLLQTFHAPTVVVELGGVWVGRAVELTCATEPKQDNSAGMVCKYIGRRIPS